MKRMLCLLCPLTLLSGCGAVRVSSRGRSIQDSAGRSVTVPDEITRVAPSGAVAQMILVTLAPELLAGVSKQPDEATMVYLPDVLGQLYGSRGDLNREALIAASPQLIVDMGKQKEHMAEDLNAMQAQIGIPTIFIEASLENLPAAYRMLGELLEKQDEAEALATYIDDALALCRENRAKIPEEKQRTVAFTTGPEGLACNAAGSVQAEVIDLMGGINAVVVPEIQNRNGGNEISMEQMYGLPCRAGLLPHFRRRAAASPDCPRFGSGSEAPSACQKSLFDTLSASQNTRLRRANFM